jgi:adenine specific DNA methylase Mod
MASYKYTEDLDKQIKQFAYKNLISISELFDSIGSWYSTYYVIKKRWIVSSWILKKLRDAWLKLDVA